MLQSYRSLLFKFWTFCIFEPPYGALGQHTLFTLGSLESSLWTSYTYSQSGCRGHSCTSRTKQDAQLSQRDRAAGCVTVFAKSRRLELGDDILRTL